MAKGRRKLALWLAAGLVAILAASSVFLLLTPSGHRIRANCYYRHFMFRDLPEESEVRNRCRKMIQSHGDIGREVVLKLFLGSRQGPHQRAAFQALRESPTANVERLLRVFLDNDAPVTPFALARKENAKHLLFELEKARGVHADRQNPYILGFFNH